MLSVGLPSTIGSYRKLCETFFGEDHPSVKYLDDLAAKSPEGLKEEIFADESQMVHLLGNMKATP
jgi:hypothetical protein